MNDDSVNDSAEDQRKQIEHLNKIRFGWHDLIEELIEEGRQQGAFDNLKGKGKPLDLSRNLYAAGMELANELLKNNQLKPAWILNRNQIQEAIQTLREEIRRTWQRHEQAYRFAVSEGQRGALRVSWDDACRRWENQMEKLNQQIRDFNLKRPSENLELFKISLERELESVAAPRWLK